MSDIPSSKKCDRCGKNRIDDTNHWVAICVTNGSVINFHYGIPHDIESQFHACGLECATILFQRWFQGGSI